jgi:hypothetical protein
VKIVHGFDASRLKSAGNASNLASGLIKLAAERLNKSANNPTIFTSRNITVFINIKRDKIFLPRNNFLRKSPVFCRG